MSIQQKTALITGASSGIGLELSHLFARDGYNLVLVARSAEKLQILAAELEKIYHVSTTILPIDLSQPGTPQRIYRQVQEKGIQIECLVNNAGFGILSELASANLEDSLEMVQLNVASLTALTHLFLPGMIKERSGRILNVGSTGSFAPVPTMAVYAATKAYVLSFTEALAEELRGTGVTVTALCPGVTITGFQARAGVGGSRLVRMGSMTAQEVAKEGYQAMQSGRMVTVPGLLNRLLAIFIPLTPRPLVLRMGRQLMQE